MAIRSFPYAEFYSGAVSLTVFYDTNSLDVTRVDCVNQRPEPVTLVFQNPALPGGQQTLSFPQGTTTRTVPAGVYKLGSNADGLFFPNPVNVSVG